MYKKHIEQMAIVAMKYFFDFDFNVLSHTFIFALVFASLFKMFFSRITAVLYDGMITVKEDALQIKSEFLTLKEGWENSEMKETLMNNLRLLKNLVPQKIS